MIGVSLPYEWLAGGIGLLGETDRVLSALRAHGVGSIELRTVLLRHDPEEVLRVANRLWDAGFRISVHVKAHSREDAVREVFSPVARVLEALRQERLCLVLHPVVGGNAAMLRELAAHRDAMGYPVTLALENNRLLPDGRAGDSAALVYEAVCQANLPDVGICFDMGHYVYHQKKHFPAEPVTLPEKDFFRRVVHTHIHALKGLNTHFPLCSPYELPLKEILEELSRGYLGVYNLELEASRFATEVEDLFGAFTASVDALDASMPHCARLYDELREQFDEEMERATSILSRTEGNFFSLVHSTFYLFQTQGFSWAMDPAFRMAWRLAKSPSRADELLKSLRLILVSHNHEDHFEPETVERLAQNDTLWVIPDFMELHARAYGVSPARMRVVHEGEELTVGPLHIRVFASRHYRPGSTHGAPEYGYYVRVRNGPSMVFPVDVRDFDPTPFASIPVADYCFSNVWLGDKRATSPEHRAWLEPFATFALARTRSHVVLTHLYESRRRDGEMWRREHAEAVAETIRATAPEVRVWIPARGEVLELEGKSNSFRDTP